MSDRHVIANIVNDNYLHMQEVFVNSMRRNSFEYLFYLRMNITVRQSMTVRARLLKALLGAGADMVAWMDADIIVRGPLEGLWDFPGSGIRIIHRPNSGETGKVQTGVMVVPHTKESFDLLDRWDDLMCEMMKGGDEHFTDQICLWRAVQDCGTHIAQLPAKFNDWRFNEDSPVWHAKGHYKTRSDVWKREWQKYRS